MHQSSRNPIWNTLLCKEVKEMKKITIFVGLVMLTLLIGCISQEEKRELPKLTPNITLESKEIMGNKVSVIVKVNNTNNCSLNLTKVRFMPDDPKYITKPKIKIFDGLCDGDSLMVNYSIDNFDFVPDGVLVIVFNDYIEYGVRIKEGVM